MKDDWKRLGIYFGSVAQGIRGAHALKEISGRVTIMSMCSRSKKNLADFAQDVAEIMDDYGKTETIIRKNIDTL